MDPDAGERQWVHFHYEQIVRPGARSFHRNQHFFEWGHTGTFSWIGIRSIVLLASGYRDLSQGLRKSFLRAASTSKYCGQDLVTFSFPLSPSGSRGLLACNRKRKLLVRSGRLKMAKIPYAPEYLVPWFSHHAMTRDSMDDCLLRLGIVRRKILCRVVRLRLQGETSSCTNATSGWIGPSGPTILKTCRSLSTALRCLIA